MRAHKSRFSILGTRPAALPHLPVGLVADASNHAQRTLIDMLCLKQDIHDPILWYYTPMAGAFSEHLRGSAVIYDCMDELSAFKSAPPALREQERALLRRADLTFTGGYSQAQAAPARAFVSEQRGYRAFRSRPRPDGRAARSVCNCASAARFLRRDRRAYGH